VFEVEETDVLLELLTAVSVRGEIERPQGIGSTAKRGT
jgi:hypothetical protein